jgi:hypothetical protein
MAGMDISYDEDGKGLDVWFDQPHKASQIEDTGSGIILRKDEQGHVIGVQHPSYFDPPATAKPTH